MTPFLRFYCFMHIHTCFSVILILDMIWLFHPLFRAMSSSGVPIFSTILFSVMYSTCAPLFVHSNCVSKTLEHPFLNRIHFFFITRVFTTHRSHLYSIRSTVILSLPIPLWFMWDTKQIFFRSYYSLLYFLIYDIFSRKAFTQFGTSRYNGKRFFITNNY